VLFGGLRRGQVNFRSHNSCLSLGACPPGRRRACVLFGIFFRGGVFSKRTTRRHGLARPPPDWVVLPERVVTEGAGGAAGPKLSSRARRLLGDLGRTDNLQATLGLCQGCVFSRKGAKSICLPG